MQDLTPAAQKFILHWGEMGTKWGINRTVAQIHALLYITPRPLNAEEICETLGVARSNVSNSLKELQNWGIVKVTHLPGDRRDHFECMKDAFEMFRVILAERKRREIDPTIAMLRECVDETGRAPGNPEDAHTRQRLEQLQEFFELGSEFYDKVNRLETPTALKLLRMGDKLFRLIGLKG